MAQPLLPATWEIPDALRKRLGAQVGRQRTREADGHLLVILHEPPGPEDDHRLGRFFWRNPDGVWSSSSLGSGAQAIVKHLDEYADRITALERREDEAVSAEDYFGVIRDILPLHRAAQHMHEALQEARDLCPDDPDIINFRDRAYGVERMAELVYSGAKNALDFAVARRSEQLAESSHRMSVSGHRLNVLAALFFPIATLTAIFGVNLRHGLEQQYAPWPFVAVLAVGLLSGVLLKSIVTSNTHD